MCQARDTLRLMTGGKVSKSLFSNGSQNFMTRFDSELSFAGFSNLRPFSYSILVLVPAGGMGSSLVHKQGDG